MGRDLVEPILLLVFLASHVVGDFQMTWLNCLAWRITMHDRKAAELVLVAKLRLLLEVLDGDFFSGVPDSRSNSFNSAVFKVVG